MRRITEKKIKKAASLLSKGLTIYGVNMALKKQYGSSIGARIMTDLCRTVRTKKKSPTSKKIQSLSRSIPMAQAEAIIGSCLSPKTASSILKKRCGVGLRPESIATLRKFLPGHRDTSISGIRLNIQSIVEAMGPNRITEISIQADGSAQVKQLQEVQFPLASV